MPEEGTSGVVFLYHGDTENYNPCKFDPSTGKIEVLSQDARHFWANQLEKAFREDLQPGFLEKYMPMIAIGILGISIMLILYVALPYVGAPLDRASNTLTLAIDKFTTHCGTPAQQVVQNITTTW